MFELVGHQGPVLALTGNDTMVVSGACDNTGAAVTSVPLTHRFFSASVGNSVWVLFANRGFESAVAIGGLHFTFFADTSQRFVSLYNSCTHQKFQGGSTPLSTSKKSTAINKKQLPSDLQADYSASPIARLHTHYKAARWSVGNCLKVRNGGVFTILPQNTMPKLC